MLCRAAGFRSPLRLDTIAKTRSGLNTVRLSSNLSIAKIQSLPSWDVDEFRRLTFLPQKPCRLPQDSGNTPLAASQWFRENQEVASGLLGTDETSRIFEVHEAFWDEYRDALVPLELTVWNEDGSPSFERSEAPLRILLDHLSSTASPTESTTAASVYLAQCPLPSLPQVFRDALPTPRLVMEAGKGDVYDSSLWLGRAPTYTPLHRDPNPNLFVQLAGRKMVRMMPPQVGDLVFQKVQQAMHEHGRPGIRGEEMMVGRERRILEQGIWPTSESKSDDATVAEINTAMHKFGQEAEIRAGEALFIPRGWWHSLKSTGRGVSASANWWFR